MKIKLAVGDHFALDSSLDTYAGDQSQVGIDYKALPEDSRPGDILLLDDGRQDPEGLLGDKKEVGITCALIPADHEGVEIGERHDPLGSAFMNGPTRGEIGRAHV